MDKPQNNLLKLALVCLLCIGLVTGLVYLIQYLLS